MDVRPELLVDAVMIELGITQAELGRRLPSSLDKLVLAKRITRWRNVDGKGSAPNYEGTMALLQLAGWLNEERMEEAVTKAAAQRAADAARAAATAAREATPQSSPRPQKARGSKP